MDGVLKIKTIALHAWLFRVEFVNTLVAISNSRMVVLGNREKIQILEVMRDNISASGYELVLVAKSGDPKEYIAEYLKSMQHGVEKPEGSKIVVGGFLKEK